MCCSAGGSSGLVPTDTFSVCLLASREPGCPCSQGTLWGTLVWDYTEVNELMSCRGTSDPGPSLAWLPMQPVWVPGDPNAKRFWIPSSVTNLVVGSSPISPSWRNARWMAPGAPTLHTPVGGPAGAEQWLHCTQDWPWFIIWSLVCHSDTAWNSE